MSEKIANFVMFNRQRTQDISVADVDKTYPLVGHIPTILGCPSALTATFATNVVFFGEKRSGRTAFSNANLNFITSTMPKNDGIRSERNNSILNSALAHETGASNTEIWKPIPDYEGLYMVSSFGRILNSRTGVFVCQYNKGRRSFYKKVELWKNKQMKRHKVHRLVASAFIPNPEGLPQINHIDENPQNNHVDNLEWCDAKHNANHGKHKARISMAQGIAVGLYSASGELVSVYPNAREASRQIGIPYCAVRSICKGERKPSGDYRLSYLNNQRRGK